MLLHNIIFINSFNNSFNNSFYKVRTKLHSNITQHDNTHFNVLIQNKKNQKTQKDKNFPKEVVENTDLHKSVLNKIMSTQE